MFYFTILHPSHKSSLSMGPSTLSKYIVLTSAIIKRYRGTPFQNKMTHKTQTKNKQICRLILRKMINFAYLCNYLFCMVKSYFQPFVYPLVALSSRFSIPKMTFLAKCFTMPFKHPHLSFSIKYV